MIHIKKTLFLFFSILALIIKAQETKNISPGLRGNGMGFTQNKGQYVDMDKNFIPDVLFKGDGGNTDVYLRKTGFSYVLSDAAEVLGKAKGLVEEMERSASASHEEMEKIKNEYLQTHLVTIHRIDVDFVNANTNTPVETADQLEGYNNYYYAHCPQGITKVHSYNAVTIKNIYNNIDVKYNGSKAQGLEYDLIVNPGGDIRNIQLQYSGMEKIHVDHNKLYIKTSSGELEERIPEIYQLVNGNKVIIKGGYVLKNNQVSFEVDNYNKTIPLIIDPWLSYYGGTGFDMGQSIATDPSGNIVISGNTQSTDFPLSAGAFQTIYGGGIGQFTIGDVFIVKMNEAGNRLWATYYGGSNTDQDTEIATDALGNIVVGGVTFSTNLPVGATGSNIVYQSTFSNVFVLKLDASGARLWATFYANIHSNSIQTPLIRITTDGSNVYLAGSVGAIDTGISTPGAYQVGLIGGSNAYLAKFSSNGNRIWGTYIGGGAEQTYAVACDPMGNIYVGGKTYLNFPVTSSAFQTSNGGNYDGFLCKFNPAGGYLWGTYYGGNGPSGDAIFDIATDGLNNVVIMGETSSTNIIASASAYQPTYAGGVLDAFVAKFNSTGNRLWSTYLGGNKNELSAYGGSIATDKDNYIYVYGESEDSYDPAYPVPSCAYQPVYAGVEDQFIAKYDLTGQQTCVTYLGGPLEDDLDLVRGPTTELAIYGNNLYVTGGAYSSYPVTTNAYQTSAGGSEDAFIDQLCTKLCEAKVLALDYSASTTSVCVNAPVTYTSLINNSCDTTGYKFQWTFTGGSPSSSTFKNPTVTYPAPGTYTSKLVLTTPCKKDSVIKTSYVTVNSCGCVLSALATTTANATCVGASNGSATATVSTGSGGTYTYSWSNGANTITASNTNQISNLSAGTYTVTITDGSCVFVSTTIITQALQVNTITPTNNVCYNGTSGSINLTVSGGSGPYTYKWSTGVSSTTSSSSSQLNNLPAGTYTITVTENSCASVSTVTVTQPLALSIGASALWSCVDNFATGTVLTANGTSPYSYSWSSGSTNSTALGLNLGTYNVTVNDVNGCTASTGLVVTKVPITVTPSSTNISCMIYAQLNPYAQGAGPLTYVWSNGYTTSNINKVPAGIYTVTITDIQGCTLTQTFNITNSSTVDGSFTQSLSGTICAGTTVNFTHTGSTTGGTLIQYNWTVGAAAFGANTQNYSYTFTSPGTYIVAHSVYIGNGSGVGCWGYASSQVTVINCSAPTVTAAPASICSGSCAAITASGSGGNSPYAYLWNTGATTQNINPCPVANTTYTVTITDAAGATGTTTAMVSVSAGITATATASNILCNGNNNGSANVSVSNGTGPYTYSWSSGSSTTTNSNLIITNLSAGIYTITVIDGACSSTTAVTVTQPAALSFAAPTITAAACGVSNGSATVTAAGGTGSLNYSWSTTATGQTINGVSAGFYIVTVTDANSCASTTSVLINSNPSATINTVNLTNVTCNGQNTGSANISASGGTGTLTYSWSNTTSGQTITNVASGTYVISVTDGSGCLTQSNVTITQPTALTTPTVTATPTGCGINTGTATVAAAGGSGSLNYLWSNGYTGTTNTNLAANTYTITVTDANNCSITNTTTIVNTSSPTINSVTPTNPLCFPGTGTVSVNATGGTGTLTYTWSNSSSGQTINNLTTGTYVITVTDANNCTNVSTVSITVPAAITISASQNTAASCNNNNGIALATAATGGTGSFNYSWSSGASGLTATNLSFGTYTITATDANGCTQTTSTLINNNPAPTINSLTPTNVLCNGTSTGSAIISASGTGTLTYNWSNGVSGTTQSQISNLTPQIYYVTVTDGNGCNVSSSVNITEPSAILLGSPTITNAACGANDGSASIAATGGSGTLNYSWSNNTTGQTISAVTSGNYIVTVTDVNSCTSTTSVLINNNPSATIDNVTVASPSCNGQNNGSALASASGGSGALTYSWSNTASGQTISNVNAGTYIVSVTDGSGCLTQSSVVITEPTTVSAQNTNAISSTCGNANGTADILVTGGTGFYTFSWSNGFVDIGFGNQSAIFGLASNTYYVTVTDQNSCSYTHTFVIGNKPSPVFTGSSPVIIPADCKGNSSGQIDVLISSGSAPYTYSWSTGASTITILQNEIQSNLPAGNYSLTITDNNGCSVDTSLTLTEPTFVFTSTVTATDATCITGGTATATIAGGNTGNYTYSWSNGTSSVSNSQLAVGNNLPAGNYTITVTDTKGCATINTTTINVPATLTVIATEQTTATCNSNNGVAVATGSGGSGSNYTYSWSNSATGLTANNLSANNYTVTITDGNGCTSTSTIAITNSNGPSVSSQSSTGTCIGESNGQAAVAVAGGSGPYTYSWSNGVMSSTTNLTSQISNLTSQTYTVTITDNNNCAIITAITVTQFPNPTANAGTDQTITSGTSIQLIASGGTSYLWTPALTLNNAGINNPIANPTQTTTYTVTVTDANSCSSTDDIIVTITIPQTCNASEADEFVANVFTPNGDGKNDILNVKGFGLTDIYFAIYNRWGQKLFETTDQTKGWDGTQNGKPIDEQTVVYYLTATCITTGANIVKKGDISVVR